MKVLVQSNMDLQNYVNALCEQLDKARELIGYSQAKRGERKREGERERERERDREGEQERESKSEQCFSFNGFNGFLSR